MDLARVPFDGFRLRMVELVGKEKRRYRFGELLRYPIHRIVFLTFENDESPAGQGIQQ